MNILEISLRFQLVGTVLAILLNIILVIIVGSTRHEAIGRFKYMIIGFAVFESVYALVVMVFMPSSFVGERTWILFSIAGPVFNTRFAVLSPILYCFFYYNWMLFVMINFVYRFIVLCRPQLTALIAESRSMKYQLGALWGLISVYFLFCASVLCTSNVASQGVREKIRSVYNSNISFNSGYVLLRITKLDGSPSLTGIIGTVNHYLFFPTTFIVIIYCCCKIIMKIRGLGMSDKGTVVHKEVLRTLVIQTSIPIVLCHIPSFIYLSFPFFAEGTSLGTFSLCFTVLGTVPKFLDPIITLVCIRKYRLKLIRIMCCRKKPTKRTPPPTKTTHASPDHPTFDQI